MDPFTIAALVAAVAGAGMQYKASSDAQERQRREIARLKRQAAKPALPPTPEPPPKSASGPVTCG